MVSIPYSPPLEVRRSHASHLAHLFDPDRFLDERLQKYLTPNPFIFLPFNAGPRICLGQQVCIFSLPHFASLASNQNSQPFFLIHSSRTTKLPSSSSASSNSSPLYHTSTMPSPLSLAHRQNGWVWRDRRAGTKSG